MLAAFILPVPALGLLAFAPRAAYTAFGPDRTRRSQLIAVALGVTLCVIGWALVSAVKT